MKIKKEAFERTILNSEYIGYYTHLLSADSCPYHLGKQLDTMRYLLENYRIEEIKANARYLFPLRKYKLPSNLQKEYQLLEESVATQQAKKVTEEQAERLALILKARQKWTANVSWQNVCEQLVIQMIHPKS